MNLKSYNKISNLKKKAHDAFVKTMRCLLYPVIKLEGRYRESEFKRKIEAKKALKEMFVSIYNDLNRFKKAELYFTPEHINENDWKINIISTRYNDTYRFHNVKYYNKWDEHRLLKELISHFTLDKDIQTETLFLRDLKEYRYWGGDVGLDSVVFKISVKENIK